MQKNSHTHRSTSPAPPIASRFINRKNPTDKGASVNSDIGAPKAPLTLGDPEWCRISDLRHLFGIRRSLAYDLVRAKHVLSVVVSQKGKLRGIRLIDVASVRSYLSSLLFKDLIDTDLDSTTLTEGNFGTAHEAADE